VWKIITFAFSFQCNHLRLTLPGPFIKNVDIKVELHHSQAAFLTDQYFGQSFLYPSPNNPYSTFFTLRASRSHRIFFVAKDSRWITTASSFAPRSYGNLGP
jgi:hypothetical protein